MGDASEKSATDRYRMYLESELEAAAMYKSLAEAEKDSERVEIFEGLVEIEMRHAARWAEKLGIDSSSLEIGPRGLKTRLLSLGARTFGTNRVLPVLLRLEAKEMDTYAGDPEAEDILDEERRHTAVLQGMVDGTVPGSGPVIPQSTVVRRGASLRAAVLGMNDGLVSNFSLVMGVAGGTDQGEIVLLAGVAGLLAGSFSMAAGEYVSVRSQRDLYEHHLSLEAIELEEHPEEEEEEMVLFYRAKGLTKGEAKRVAKRLMARPKVALDTMAREEFGLDPAQQGSPWAAAISSYFAFILGALVPILPYIFDKGDLAFSLSAGLSAGALLIVGGTLAAATSRSAAWGALRMLLAGGSAAAVTFGIGTLIGVTLLD